MKKVATQIDINTYKKLATKAKRMNMSIQELIVEIIKKKAG